MFPPSAFPGRHGTQLMINCGLKPLRSFGQIFQYACQVFREVEFRRRDAVTAASRARPSSPQSPFGDCDPKPHTLNIPLGAVAASSFGECHCAAEVSRVAAQ